MHVPDYSENEHQLLNFIVREILPEFGICSYQPEIKVEVKEEKKKGTIWGKMVDKVTPFGKYPEKISEEEGRGLRGPKGKAEIIKNFSIWGPRVFPLIEEENAPPEIDENIYIKFEGKKYFYLTPVLASEINNLYQSSMEMEFKSEIFKELKAGTLEEFKILKDIVGEFNSIHKDRRIDKSEKGYTISIDTYPAYVMFCTKHKTYYLFPKATIGLTIDWQGQSSGPRVINPQNYQHPYVFSDGKICYGSFESYIPLDRPGIRIAKYLLLGRDCLMTSPIDGIDEANPYHERFQKISKEERAEKRIPITNFKNVWMENEF
jgi:hypothetical protein